MTGLVQVAALSAALAAYLAIRPHRPDPRLTLVARRRAHNRLQRIRGGGAVPPSRAEGTAATAARESEREPRESEREGHSAPAAQVAACLLTGVAAWLLVGDALGLMLGFGIAIGGPRLLRNLEPGEERRRRVSIEMSAASVADLLAACLASGASTPAATRATAEAIGGPTGDLLRQCVAHFELGAESARVWAPILAEPALAPIARAILRSAQTGAPLTAVLLRVGDDLRSTRKAQLDQAAKAVGVKAVGPLGLCFLPAFMLLGVVPLIASLVTVGLG